MKKKITNNLAVLSAVVAVSIFAIFCVSGRKIPFLIVSFPYAIALVILARILKVLRALRLEYVNGPARYCRGTGIEIGSCGRHAVKGSILVDMIEDFGTSTPYRVDIVADAHDLAGIESASLEYVCASHVLEHLTNPIKAILEWMRILKTGGILWLKIPDKRKTFDSGRARTTLDHLIEDLRNDVPADDPGHIAEHNRNFTPAHDDRHPYIHNHAWVPDDVIELFRYINARLAPSRIVRYSENTCANAQDFWIAVEKQGPSATLRPSRYVR